MFNYRYFEHWKFDFFNSKWCCKCRSKPSTKEKLYQQARKKMAKELDVLSLLNDLRVSRFIARTTLEAHQQLLIRLFDNYTLGLRQSPAKQDMP